MTQDSEGLQNCPRIRVQLGGGNIENLKDSHSKVIEGKSYVQVGKECAIHEEKVMRRIFPTVTHTVGHAANIHGQRLGRTIRR